MDRPFPRDTRHQAGASKGSKARTSRPTRVLSLVTRSAHANSAKKQGQVLSIVLVRVATTRITMSSPTSVAMATAATAATTATAGRQRTAVPRAPPELPAYKKRFNEYLTQPPSSGGGIGTLAVWGYQKIKENKNHNP